MRKLISSMLVVMCVMLLSINVSAADNIFTDVKDGKYYTDSVYYLNERGIMTGYNTERFGVGRNLKREEMVTLIWKAEGKPVDDSSVSYFVDVLGPKYYATATRWAKTNDIITGLNPFFFGTGYYITRQDFVKILYGYARYKGYSTDVNSSISYHEREDYTLVSSYATESMNWAYEYGLIGVGSNLKPKDNILREEAATIIARFFKRYELLTDSGENEELTFYRKLFKGRPVNILIVGDSIGYGEGASTAQKMWFNLLGKYIEKTFGSKVNIANISMPGNTSYAEYTRVSMLDTEQKFDLAILCCGHNDTSLSYFYESYEALIRVIQKRWPDCSMISILQSSQMKYTDMVNATIEMANYYGIPIADTIAPFINGSYGSYKSLTTDMIHPNDKGQQIYADAVAGLINVMVYKGLSGKINEIEPLYYRVYLEDNYNWIPASSFKKVDEVTYVYKPQATIHGLTSLYYTFMRGGNLCTVYFDGEKITDLSIKLDYADRQEQIVKWTESFYDINSEVKIVFENKQQADWFFGMGVSWGEIPEENS